MIREWFKSDIACMVICVASLLAVFAVEIHRGLLDFEYQTDSGQLALWVREVCR